MGGTKEDASNQIKEYTLETLGEWWPEFYLVGTLPASGLYARHIKGFSVINFQLITINNDERPLIVFDDVVDAQLSSILLNRKPVSKEQIVKK